MIYQVAQVARACVKTYHLAPFGARLVKFGKQVAQAARAIQMWKYHFVSFGARLAKFGTHVTQAARAEQVWEI